MALELGKKVSFSGKGASASKAKGVSQGKADYPSKTYINLIVSEKKSVDLRRTIPSIVAVVVIVALFAKFGVFDFYARVNDEAAELAKQKQTLDSYVVQLADYDKVLAEYEGYESLSITSDGLQVNIEETLALVDRFIAPAARVSTLSLSGNTLVLNLTNISLDGVGQLVSTLYQQDIVQNVSVANASQQQTESEDVTTSMTITLKPMVE